MSNFSEVMIGNPPRFVVLFQRGHDGSEEFRWGVLGNIPILTLIGYLVHVQADIVNDEWMPECDEPALVITWHEEDHSLRHFLHPDIPRDPLVGMLETIKGLLVNSRLAQHAAAQQTRLLGPDGQPMSR